MYDNENDFIERNEQSEKEHSILLSKLMEMKHQLTLVKDKDEKKQIKKHIKLLEKQAVIYEKELLKREIARQLKKTKKKLVLELQI